MADKGSEVDGQLVHYTAELIRLQVDDPAVNAKLRRARAALDQDKLDDAAKLVGEIRQAVEQAKKSRKTTGNG